MKRKNVYSVSEFINNVYALILTKIFYPQCRLIRRPVVMRGRKSLIGAAELTIGKNCRFDLDGKKETLEIGKNCEFGDNTHIVALNSVKIGDNVLIASKTFISDCSHGYYGDEKATSSPDVPPNERELSFDEVVIGNNVWIGENAVILLGSHIGDGCIIGANAVITKDIPNNCIVVGNNKIIKNYDSSTRKWVSVHESITN